MSWNQWFEIESRDSNDHAFFPPFFLIICSVRYGSPVFSLKKTEKRTNRFHLIEASNLDFYGLTTYSPSEIHVAISHGAKPPRLFYPSIKPFFVRDRFYTPAIESVRIQAGEVRVYGKEKTICDMFRYRRKLGEDLAMEALKQYLKLKDANTARLLKYAAIWEDE